MAHDHLPRIPDPMHANHTDTSRFSDNSTHQHLHANDPYNSSKAEKGFSQTISTTDVDKLSTDELQRQKSVRNEVNFAFIMTMVGFSILFCTAEVTPLLFVTTFTIIAYDLDQGAHVVWLLVSGYIAIGAIVPFVGIISDLLGRKGITLFSIGAGIVGMILMGTTPNLAGFIAGQVFSGIAIGIQLLTTIAAVTELVPVDKRGITIGYIVIGFMPFAAASVYGQLLAEHNWRYIPLLIGILYIISFVLVAIYYKPPPRANSVGLTRRELLGRIDFIGGILSIAGITIFLVGLNWGGQDYAWGSKQVISTLVVGIVLLIIFAAWEKFGTKYPLFPARLIGDKRIFFAIAFLCLVSGVNFIPVVVFWGVQCYTVYRNDFFQAGIHLLPLGFCIAGGAIISAAAMSAFKNHIHWVLLFFCAMQTAGLGAMAAIDPGNINTAWAPMVIGLIGVGGVLLPSQIVFSIISPEDLIGTSVALSIVVRAFGQVIGVSMFYNIFSTTTTDNALANPNLFTQWALGLGIFGKDASGNVTIAATTERIKFLIITLSAGPLKYYAPKYFPELDTPEKVEIIQAAGSALYRMSFPKMYLAAIAWGGAACIACFFLRGTRKYMTDVVAVHL